MEIIKVKNRPYGGRKMVRVKNEKLKIARTKERNGTGEKRKSRKTPVRRGEMVRVKNAKVEEHPFAGERWYG